MENTMTTGTATLLGSFKRPSLPARWEIRWDRARHEAIMSGMTLDAAVQHATTVVSLAMEMESLGIKPTRRGRR